MISREFAGMVEKCREAMYRAGVTQGDKVAVISSNRIEWAVSAYSTFSLGKGTCSGNQCSKSSIVIFHSIMKTGGEKKMAGLNHSTSKASK